MSNVIDVVNDCVFYGNEEKNLFLMIGPGSRPDFCVGSFNELVDTTNYMERCAYHKCFITASEGRPRMSELGPITGHMFSIKMSYQQPPKELHIYGSDSNKLITFKKVNKNEIISRLKER